jgi:PD-(D/E)XK nuclease superfamily
LNPGYASVFYAWFVASGLDVPVEDATNHGRVDMAVVMPAHIYLFEFKMVESVPEGWALQQLRDKGYADKYRAYGGRFI